MKKLLLIPFVLAISLVSKAQTDPSSVEQYCEVITTPRLLSNKVTLEVNYAEEQSYWKDKKLKSEATLKKFNSVIDALN